MKRLIITLIALASTLLVASPAHAADPTQELVTPCPYGFPQEHCTVQIVDQIGKLLTFADDATRVIAEQHDSITQLHTQLDEQRWAYEAKLATKTSTIQKLRAQLRSLGVKPVA